MITIKLNQVQYGKNAVTPVLHKNAFYKVYSPKAFKLKPMESITIDLKINIIWAEGLKPKDFDLFPSLKKFGLSLEETNWKEVSSTATEFIPQKTSIVVTILNKNCSNSFNIKKGNLLLYFLLPYTNKKIKTDYVYNKSFD